MTENGLRVPRVPFSRAHALESHTPAEIRHRLRTGAWQRPFRGVHVRGAEPLTLHERAMAALFAVGRFAAVGLTTAAQLHRFGVLASDAIELIVPRGVDGLNQPGLKVTTARLSPSDVQLLDGIPCTTARRTAVDLARRSRRLDGIAVLDAALRAGPVRPADLFMELEHHAGLRNIRRARELVGLADGRAESPMESRLRLVIHDAGMPAAVPQLWIPTDNPRYRVDLAWTRQRVAAEYEGEVHRDPGQFRKDRERHNWLAVRGWQLLYFTDTDVYHRPHRIAHTLHWALTPHGPTLADHRERVAS